MLTILVIQRASLIIFKKAQEFKYCVNNKYPIDDFNEENIHSIEQDQQMLTQEQKKNMISLFKDYMDWETYKILYIQLNNFKFICIVTLNCIILVIKLFN